MTLAQVQATVATILTQIDEQTGLINNFRSDTQDSMKLVQSSLQGSQGGHDQAMLAALSRSEDSLNKALQALAQAGKSAMKVKEL